jgi:hypothetical protein
VVALVVVLAGCQVRTDVAVDVKDDGSGTVTVSVGLDDASVQAVGDLATVVKVDDLRAAGWTVNGPTKETDGFTYLRLSKPFASVEQANVIFEEIAGAGGPFRDFTLERSRSFARTKTGFTGTIDFTGGLASFADSDLAQQLDGKPLGEDIAALEQRIGNTLDNVFRFRVLVRLPGDVTSNAPGGASNGAVWEPHLSDTAPLSLTAQGRSWRVTTLVFTAVAVVAAAALLVILLIRIAVRRTDRRTPPPPATPPSPSSPPFSTQ